jgi:hypothetical protein
MKSDEKRKEELKKKISHLSTLMEVSEGYPAYNEYSKEFDLVALELHDVLQLKIDKKMEKKKVADIEPINVKGVIKCPVNQYGLDGKFIKSFESISQASKEISIQYLSISKCANGKQKSAGGFQWRKAE